VQCRLRFAHVATAKVRRKCATSKLELTHESK
jgi:hypothetical protein